MATSLTVGVVHPLVMFGTKRESVASPSMSGRRKIKRRVTILMDNTKAIYVLINRTDEDDVVMIGYAESEKEAVQKANEVRGVLDAAGYDPSLNVIKVMPL
jgi:hypothetical protein